MAQIKISSPLVIAPYICSSCSAGQYVETSTGACLMCPLGYVSKTLNSVTCGQCGKGSKGESSEPGDSACSSCGLGKYQLSPGVCASCAPGQYASDKGLKSCTKCSVDTYLSEFGKSSKADCLPCSVEKSTGVISGAIEAASCLCKREKFYADDTGTCVPCETGADCSSKDGLRLTELMAKPGYWRPSLDSKVFSPCVAGYSSLEAQNLANARCCPVDPVTNVSICARNFTNKRSARLNFTLDDQCAEGFSGPLCLVCAEGYVKQGEGCISCPQGASIAIAALPLVGILVSLIALLFLLFTCGKKVEAKAENRGAKWFGQAKVSYFQIYEFKFI